MTETLCAICAENLANPLICTRCTRRLRTHLDNIGRMRAELDPTPGRGRPGRPAGKPGSRPPANLTVIAMTDTRSHIRIREQGDHDPDDVACIDAELLSEARWVIEQRRLNPPMRDAFDSIRILNIHHDWITRHPRIDEHAAIIETCAAGLRAVLRDRPDTAVGQCTAAHPERDTCGGPLRLDWRGPLPIDPAAQVSPTHIVCGWCGDAWIIDPLTLIGMLRVVQPKAFPVTRAWIIDNLGVNPATLRQWISRGHVRGYADDQVDLFDVVNRVR